MCVTFSFKLNDSLLGDLSNEGDELRPILHFVSRFAIVAGHIKRAALTKRPVEGLRRRFSPPDTKADENSIRISSQEGPEVSKASPELSQDWRDDDVRKERCGPCVPS